MFETATPSITVIGEVANFKVNQNKWVFFDVKDEESSLGCFMSAFNLRVAVEDGMQVAVTARPTVTKWGKFSLTVQEIKPVGEGSIKRAFELLRAKLDNEGLFALERKRPLPVLPAKIGVISSVDAAGYKDFIKILGQRFGGIEISVINTQVQGQPAAEQIIAALGQFNEMAEPPEVIAILRGGGSRDDLAVFDDEPLVRALAASRVPTITGIGHEIDVTLADLAADARASTPSNAAEILVPDRREIVAELDERLRHLMTHANNNLVQAEQFVAAACAKMSTTITRRLDKFDARLELMTATLRQLDPRTILRRGYAIVRDETGRIVRGGVKVGAKLVIENLDNLIETEVKNVRKK
jgi:exodeoxyribonuclease VII large subunit